MTTQQIILFACAYLIALGAVIYFTRATARRVMGAVAGGAAAGLLGVGAIALCESLGWWWVPYASTPYFLALFYLGVSISHDANLPRHLAAGPPVRMARPGGVHWYRDGHRPAAGLLYRGDVPEVDGVRTGRCSHPRGRRDLFRYCGPGARRDAPYRRPRPRGPVGATSQESRLTRWQSGANQAAKTREGTNLK